MQKISPQFSPSKKLGDNLQKVALLGLLFLVAYVFVSHARLLSFRDASAARRALLIVDATDIQWTFTMAYQILGDLNKFWSENLFYLRGFGLLMVGLGSLIFSLSALFTLKAGSEKLLVFCTLFISGLGVYGYSPNSVPEYNHLAVFCVLGIGANLIHLNNKGEHIPLINKILLGFLFALFMAVNLPSAFLVLIFFFLFWFLRIPTPHFNVRLVRDRLVNIFLVLLFSASFFLLLCVLYEPSSGPGRGILQYNEEALRELKGVLYIGHQNFLYLILRVITFAIEFIALCLVLGISFLVGRKISDFRSSLRYLVFFLPILWFAVSTWFIYRGFETYQVPSKWNFSLGFFWGKIVWYGHATTLPLLVFMGVFMGACKMKSLSRRDFALCLFFLLTSLSGCFASGARIVHKLFLYQWAVIFIFLFLFRYARESALSKRTFLAFVVLLVSCQLVALQMVPVTKMGGIGTFAFSLEDLPRGRGVLVQKDFYDWMKALSFHTGKLGFAKNEPVVSNDDLAIFLLGFHQVYDFDVSDSERGTDYRFGLIHFQVTEDLQSTINRNQILKILGPPNLPQAMREEGKRLEDYLQSNSFHRAEEIKRGESSYNLIYVGKYK